MWIILLTGGIAAVYTIMGGMAASIWTDVVQAIVLYIGGLVAVIVMMIEIPGGMGTILDVANANDKFSLGPMQWDLSQRTFWTMAILGLTTWLTGFVGDQNMVQRYLSAKSTREAQKATMLCTVMSLPTWLFFFFIGTCLFVFYTVFPEPAVQAMSPDHVFPHFIMSKLPAGLSGLVIAGVLSAAMGSLSSSLNAFATVSVVDIISPYLLKNRDDRFYTRLARMLTGVATLVMFGVSFTFLYAEKESFLDLSLKLIGLLGGLTVAFFMLGFFARRVNRRILWQAFAVAFPLNVYLAFVEWGWIPNFLHIHIHPYWVGTFVVLVMIALAVILAKIQRTPPVEGEGMTIIGEPSGRYRGGTH